MKRKISLLIAGIGVVVMLCAVVYFVLPYFRYPYSDFPPMTPDPYQKVQIEKIEKQGSIVKLTCRNIGQVEAIITYAKLVDSDNNLLEETEVPTVTLPVGGSTVTVTCTFSTLYTPMDRTFQVILANNRGNDFFSPPFKA